MNSKKKDGRNSSKQREYNPTESSEILQEMYIFLSSSFILVFRYHFKPPTQCKCCLAEKLE